MNQMLDHPVLASGHCPLHKRRQEKSPRIPLGHGAAAGQDAHILVLPNHLVAG